MLPATFPLGMCPASTTKDPALKLSRMVQSIHSRALRDAPGRIAVQIKYRNYLPLMPLRSVVVENLKDVKLDRSLWELAQKKARAEEIVEAEGLKKYLQRVTTAPYKAYRYLRDFMSTDDFVGLRINEGKALQVHARGHVWEQRGLDRLFGVRQQWGGASWAGV